MSTIKMESSGMLSNGGNAHAKTGRTFVFPVIREEYAEYFPGFAQMITTGKTTVFRRGKRIFISERRAGREDPLDNL